MPRALLSVSDKTGIEDFARELRALGYDIISTGGTAQALQVAGIPVTAVESVTQFPECFGGRVKTMHPKIMGGVLYRRGNKEDEKQAKDLGIEAIDLVCVNLYPFGKRAKGEGQVAKENEKSQIELIDIGGPTLLRSAAKNYDAVTVICDPADYVHVLEELKETKTTTPELRKALAAKVFLHTAAYDALITEYLSGGANAGVMLTAGKSLRYGENPHQWGKYYGLYHANDKKEEDRKQRTENSETNNCHLSSDVCPLSEGWGLLHQGKELSYLNILDADAAWNAVCEFDDPTAVFVKHANPSGIASHENIEEAFQRAYDADRLSAFGVIIALNETCTAGIAQKIIDQKIFTEVIVAPGYQAKALDILKQKPNIRVIEQTESNQPSAISYRSVLGGMLVQSHDLRVITEADLKIVTQKKPTVEQIADLLFAWSCVKHAKSNAIVFVKDRVTVGIGAGQTSRVDSTWIAARRAGLRARSAVMASDAFFPFPDSIEEAAKHGIAAIIQPGGSVRDEEVFKKADELGLVMVLTGVRAFRH